MPSLMRDGIDPDPIGQFLIHDTIRKLGQAKCSFAGAAKKCVAFRVFSDGINGCLDCFGEALSHLD